MSTVDEFYFDAWMKLAQTDPEAFEARRQAAVEALIANAPADQQRRLRGLQWRVDMERQRSRTPMASCVKVFNMMWNQVYGEGGLQDALGGRLERAEAADVVPMSHQDADSA